MLRKFVEVTLSQHREKEHRAPVYRILFGWRTKGIVVTKSRINSGIRVSVGSVLMWLRNDIKFPTKSKNAAFKNVHDLWTHYGFSISMK